MQEIRRRRFEVSRLLEAHHDKTLEASLLHTISVRSLSVAISSMRFVKEFVVTHFRRKRGKKGGAKEHLRSTEDFSSVLAYLANLLTYRTTASPKSIRIHSKSHWLFQSPKSAMKGAVCRQEVVLTKKKKRSQIGGIGSKKNASRIAYQNQGLQCF